jgi:hypothetical protein
MARISTVKLDTSVEAADRLLGSNSGGATKNFQVSDIAQFLGATNATGIAGSVPFKYTTSANMSPGTMQVKPLLNQAFPTTNNVNLVVSKYQNGPAGKLALAVLNTYVTKDIVICQVQDPSVFAVYRVKTITQVGSTDYYEISMTHLQSNNNSDGVGFISDVYYVLTPYSGAQDKNFTSSFSTNDLVSDSGQYYLLVNHNLGKFPNITVKISTGSIVQVPIVHITNNQSKVFFKGLNSGVIHAN